ncbi:hypothetical protein GCM10007028_03700 [Algibacter mikhailovii]|uniref:Uncharacterized protein n=1 Tax=Algibacter mikhailovii TaxID=425498 RepID=A0A918QRQ3_9FLAO|nr:hypothetical protein GCM10007028_03700 [Algibacter mikhailovii]
MPRVIGTTHANKSTIDLLNPNICCDDRSAIKPNNKPPMDDLLLNSGDFVCKAANQSPIDIVNNRVPITVKRVMVVSINNTERRL